MGKRKLVKEGDNYWEPDTGNIYNKDGVLVMHDAVYRKPEFEDKINFNDYELVDRDGCRLYSKEYYKEVPTVTVAVNTDYNKFEYVSGSLRDFDLPTRATKGSAGYDFHSPIDIAIAPNETVFISLEVKCKVKPGEFLMIVPRSSLGFKGLNHVMLTNTTGIIDADYYNNPDNEGLIGLKLHNFGSNIFVIHKNDKIVQGIFVKFDTTIDDDKVEKPERTGGWGSTDVHTCKIKSCPDTGIVTY